MSRHSSFNNRRSYKKVFLLLIMVVVVWVVSYKYSQENNASIVQTTWTTSQ